MASQFSRAFCQTAKGRLYSTQTAQKAASTVGSLAAEPAKVTNSASCRVASIENYSKLSRVTVVTKAGSRYEDPSNLGVTHCLRHAANLSTPQRSNFRLIKDTEFLGTSLSISTTREYAYYTVECLRENIKDAVDILTPIVSRAYIINANWRDLKGLKPQMELDLASLYLQPNVQTVELLHKAAFKDTLGNSLYSPQSFVGSHQPRQLLQFMKRQYSKGRVGLVGVGVDHDILQDVADKLVFKENRFANNKKAKYYGGEEREDRPGMNMTYVAVATEGPSLDSQDLLPAAVLQQIMGTGTQIKHNQSLAGSKLVKAVSKATNEPFAINGLSVNYSDSGLFGFMCAALPEDMDKVLRAAFSEFASLTKVGLTEAEVARGKSLLKSKIMMSAEGGLCELTNLAEQAMVSDTISTPSQVAALVNHIQVADVVNVAKKLINSKPSMSAVGNLHNTPYLHELLK